MLTLFLIYYFLFICTSDAVVYVRIDRALEVYYITMDETDKDETAPPVTELPSTVRKYFFIKSCLFSSLLLGHLFSFLEFASRYLFCYSVIHKCIYILS